VKIWVRIFLLAASVTLVSILVTGVFSIRGGYRSLLDSEVRSLLRVTEAAASVVANQARTARYAAGPGGSGEQAPASTLESVKQIQGPLLGGGTELEIYSVDLEPVYSEGHAEGPPGAADSPELAAAAKGRSTYILRRPAGGLRLYLAASETVVDQTFVFRASTPLDVLDEFLRSQDLFLGIICAIAAIILCGAAFVGSRAITSELEALTLQAAAIGRGDYGGRAAARGAGEVAALASALNRMADGVEAAVNRLRAEKADRQSFIDDLTHELRTPVSSIVGFADHLRRRPYDEAVFSESLTRIHDEGLRILAVSEGLKRLLLSRTQPKVLQEERVVGILDRAAVDARARNADHQVQIESPADAGTLGVDRDLILTALGNLLDNAMRACPPGTVITIGFGRDGAARWLFVSDPGGGGARGEAGFGLGISICREIADYHGARLEYETANGGGTIARIVFPNLQ